MVFFRDYLSCHREWTIKEKTTTYVIPIPKFPVTFRDQVLQMLIPNSNTESLSSEILHRRPVRRQNGRQATITSTPNLHEFDNTPFSQVTGLLRLVGASRVMNN